MIDAKTAKIVRMLLDANNIKPIDKNGLIVIESARLTDYGCRCVLKDGRLLELHKKTPHKQTAKQKSIAKQKRKRRINQLQSKNQLKSRKDKIK